MTNFACPISADEILLQTFLMPDPAICGEADLYIHRDTGVALELESGALCFAEGSTVWFDTYMNLFNLGVWSRACALGGLAVRLKGEGRVAAQVTREKAPHDADILVETMIDLTPEGVTLDLSDALGSDAEGLPSQTGLLKLRLVAHGPARLDAGGFVARPQGTPHEVRLAVAITTFRREREVAATTKRMAAFLDREGDRLGAEAHLFVVDNGGTAEVAPHPRVSRIENPNLGGAGGFARGLALAQDGDFTHCLFMDDDASFQMENLTRTIAFLRLARSEAAAVSGAMISEARKWMMWENGAVFHRMCRPQFVGTDLRNSVAVSHMEFAAAAPKPRGFYGGWWFFAFPVARARRFPFPFFVRGDDISFSLAHEFDTVTLNGVVSFQEDFSAKESPLTLYLDLRNHLHQHLVHPHLEIGSSGTIKIAMHFLLRSIIRMHYDSAEAQLAAWEDVMRGPEFFEENADMSKRRPEISALARTEAWHSDTSEQDDYPVPRGFGLRREKLLKYTLNGHLLPFWSRLAGKVGVPVAERGLIWPLWGKYTARFIDIEKGRSYEVTHDKARFARIMWQALNLARRWRREYPELRAAHREGYERLAARGFWETRFPAAPAPVARPEPVSAE